MRKIEKEMCAAISNNLEHWSKANTSVSKDSDGVHNVYLHGNLIAKVSDTDVQIFDGGWQSNTTKSRLNAICREFCIEGEGIFQKNFTWYIQKCVGQAGTSKVYNSEEFTNGYIFA